MWLLLETVRTFLQITQARLPQISFHCERGQGIWFSCKSYREPVTCPSDHPVDQHSIGSWVCSVRGATVSRVAKHTQRYNYRKRNDKFSHGIKSKRSHSTPDWSLQTVKLEPPLSLWSPWHTHSSFWRASRWFRSWRYLTTWLEMPCTTDIRLRSYGQTSKLLL